MFGFFKKHKQSPISAVKATAPHIAEKVREPARIELISEDEFRTLYELGFRSSANASIFYAHCAGFKGRTLDTNNFKEFVNLVLRKNPDDFTVEGIRFATKHRTKELIDSLLGDYWEMTLGLISNEEFARRQFASLGHSSNELLGTHTEQGKNWEQAEVITRLRAKAIKLGLREPYSEYIDDFDHEKIALEICLRKKDEDIAKLIGAIDEKFEALGPIFSRLRNASVNKYGDYDFDPQLNELEEFISYSFEEDDFDFYFTLKPLLVLLAHIEERLEGRMASDEMPVDGIEFEHWCAEKLRMQGWDVSVSQASGDQGVDVLAKREGYAVAVQCKRYSKPIGNTAVQEVFAGARNLDVPLACVIGTGGFTKSAKEIASSTGVVLMDAMNIENFSEQFGLISLSGDDESQMANTPQSSLEGQLVELEFEGDGGALFGHLLRSTLATAAAEDLGIPQETEARILASLNETSGNGLLSVSESDACLILIIGASALKGEVFLNEKTVKAMSEHPQYDVDLMQPLIGQRATIDQLVSRNSLEAMKTVLFDHSHKLTEQYGELARQSIDLYLS